MIQGEINWKCLIESSKPRKLSLLKYLKLIFFRNMHCSFKITIIALRSHQFYSLIHICDPLRTVFSRLTMLYHSNAFGCVAWKKYFILYAMRYSLIAGAAAMYETLCIFFCSAFFRFSRSFTQFRSCSGCCWFIFYFRFHSFWSCLKFQSNENAFVKYFSVLYFSVNIYFVNAVYSGRPLSVVEQSMLAVEKSLSVFSP